MQDETATFPQLFSRRLQKMMARKGMRFNRDLSRALSDEGVEVSDSTISAWVNGKYAPDARFHAPLVTVLGCTYAALFTGYSLQGRNYEVLEQSCRDNDTLSMAPNSAFAQSYEDDDIAVEEFIRMRMERYLAAARKLPGGMRYALAQVQKALDHEDLRYLEPQPMENEE